VGDRGDPDDPRRAAELRNTYEVPARAGARTISWRSRHPATGALEGVFFVADDAIAS
jgi:hypothetical protein